MPGKVAEGIELLHTLKGEKTLHRLAWSPDGRLLAALSELGVIKLWDARTGAELRSLKTAGTTRDLSWSPDAKRLVSTEVETGLLHLWDVPTGRLLRTFKPVKRRQDSETSPVKAQGFTIKVLRKEPEDACIAWSPNGEWVATVSSGGILYLRSIRTGRSIKQLASTAGRMVRELMWSPDGQQIAIQLTAGPMCLWNVETGHFYWAHLWSPTSKPKKDTEPPDQNWLSRDDLFRAVLELNLNTPMLDQPNSLAWSSSSGLLAIGSTDGSIVLWDSSTNTNVGRLEGHTGEVSAVSFSHDGLFLASKSQDNTLRLWRTDTWATVLTLPESKEPNRYSSGLAFHPSAPLLAIREDWSSTLRIWRLNPERLLRTTSQVKPIHYTTAKVVLVGESGVGKTGLGWRLAHGEFKEHASTHGQQFWALQELKATRADGVECEAVLWDLAGQPDYRLVHALFLDDVDLALVLFDPANRQEPLKGIEYWRKQLTHGREHPPRMILVAARMDRGTPTLLRKELEDFCQRQGISGGYVGTSARTGEGLEELLGRMKEQIGWDSMTTTVTTETFKRIKQYVLSLKEDPQRRTVLVSPEALRQRLEKSDPSWRFTDAEMMTAVNHLSNHGYTALLRGSKGERTLLLVPELLAQLASSLVNEARRNVRGLGALEEERVLKNGYAFPELEGLPRHEQDVLLDTTLGMFLQRNLCFRESLGTQTLLFFPSLINQKRPLVEDIELLEDVSYSVTGAVENVYAALVVLLGYTNTFTRTHQWQNQAQYEARPGEVCGFRQVEEREGESEFILYHGRGTPPPMRLLFQGLVESFLRGRNVTVTRFPLVSCPKCNYTQQRAEVMRRIREGRGSLFCNNCGTKIFLPTQGEAVALSPGEREELLLEQLRTQRRTAFETALVGVKGFLREREKAPRTFLSYAWEGPEVTRWVERLAADLRNAGVDTILDQQHNAALGRSIARFITEGIEGCDFVVVVGTPRYKEKYDNRVASLGSIVAAEVDLIHQRLLGPESLKETVLPLLLEGEEVTSLPPLLRKRTYGDFRDEETYFSALFDLILTLHKVPFEHPAVSDLRESLRKLSTGLALPLGAG